VKIRVTAVEPLRKKERWVGFTCSVGTMSKDHVSITYISCLLMTLSKVASLSVTMLWAWIDVEHSEGALSRLVVLCLPWFCVEPHTFNELNLSLSFCALHGFVLA
jgi:hypothetical protein